ncbi:triacylglycerol lipase OBL1-like [Hibiscus syriacus]|nr:triacylglycerol lipase OBL1-like [Hibiscus syriacus]
MAKTHSGFMKALGLQKNKGFPKDQHSTDSRQYAYYTLRRKLREVLQVNPEARFILTGHSSGGATAILFAAVLVLHQEEWLLERLDAVYTFGHPRVADSKFGEFIEKKLSKFDVKYYRYVYNNDHGPRLPYDDSIFFFKHFGTCIFFNRRYEGNVLAVEPDKNLYPWLWTFPKMMDAVWEFIMVSFCLKKRVENTGKPGL